MEKNRKKSGWPALILLGILALAAAATAYFLYINPSDDSPRQEVAAKIKTKSDPQKVSTKIKRKVMVPGKTEPAPGDSTHEDSAGDRLSGGQTPGERPENKVVYTAPTDETMPRDERKRIERQSINTPKTGDVVFDRPDQRPPNEEPTNPPSDIKVTFKSESPPRPGPPSSKPSVLPEPKPTPDPTAIMINRDPMPKPAQTPDAPKTTTQTAKAPEKASPPPSTEKKKSGIWAINALSTQDVKVADKISASLKESSYIVYSYQANVKGKDWYRIRVGFFNSKSEAETVGRDLAKKYKLPEPWIVKPGPKELETYYLPQ